MTHTYIYMFGSDLLTFRSERWRLKVPEKVSDGSSTFSLQSIKVETGCKLLGVVWLFRSGDVGLVLLRGHKKVERLFPRLRHQISKFQTNCPELPHPMHHSALSSPMSLLSEEPFFEPPTKPQGVLPNISLVEPLVFLCSAKLSGATSSNAALCPLITYVEEPCCQRNSFWDSHQKPKDSCPKSLS